MQRTQKDLKNRISRHLLSHEKNLIPQEVRKHPNFYINTNHRDGKLRIKGRGVGDGSAFTERKVLRKHASRLNSQYDGTANSLGKPNHREDGSLMKNPPKKKKSCS